ncbi:MAG: LapA family protein [Firmicutes bacterium]|nr:LapA family protein [Bacillota bacterium]
MKPKLIVILSVILLFLIILAQNTNVITFSVLFWKITMSSFLLIGFSVLTGFILGYVTFLLTRKQ